MIEINKLQYFVGKVCTILTNPTTRDYNDQQHANCFVGVIESIDNIGIWLEQITTGKKSFFQIPIVGIIEETFRELSNDESQAVQARINTNQPLSNNKKNDLIGIDELTKDWNKFKKK